MQKQENNKDVSPKEVFGAYVKSKFDNSDMYEEITDIPKQNNNVKPSPKEVFGDYVKSKFDKNQNFNNFGMYKGITDVPKLNAEEEIKRMCEKNRIEILSKDLVPELIENEKQKRELKKKLMTYIQVVIMFQLAFIGLPILGLFFAIMFDFPVLNDVNNSLEQIFSFLKTYITIIIVEFIAMLFFIVKYVFDKSIVDLIKEFKNNDNDKNRNKNKDK
ncbi:MAG: hypothetical protein UE295_00140 [Acutalibacteraceae bacterium]|nr:hypothetical protein [Acutalibacteraceae bacterium]